MHARIDTYSQLKADLKQELQRKGAHPQVFSNHLSALNGFMQFLEVTDDMPIGGALRGGFRENLARRAASAPVADNKSRHAANQRSLLKKWHLHLLAADRHFAASSGAASPFVETLRILVEDVPKKRVAREAGISLSNLKRWLLGSQPKLKAGPQLARLEQFFGLAPGELLAKAGFARSCATVRQEPPLRSEYSQRLSEACKSPYCLKSPGERFRTQWSQFVGYKTAAFTPGLKRQKNGVWSRDVDHYVSRTEGNWYAFHGDAYVPSASINWQHVSSFLGWASLPETDGGCALSKEAAEHLGWFSDAGMLAAYVSWRIERSGSTRHAGITSFLTFAESLLHPTTGYLSQRVDLAPPGCTVQPTDWAARCTEARAIAKALRTSDRANGEDETEESRRDAIESRNARLAIAATLALDEPLQAVADMTHRMVRARPLTGGVAEALSVRDELVVKLLTSNPLRAKNLKRMRIGGGKYERIYQKPDGSWWIFVPARAFKNFKGAAKKRAYDAPIQGKRPVCTVLL